MILVDHQIKSHIESGHITVSPFDPALINPNSLDLRLDNAFKKYAGFMCNPIDPYKEDDIQAGLTTIYGKFVLSPGYFVLGSTVEKVSLPADICAELSGKSSLARLGVQVHVTGGWIDAGFQGSITLEMANVGRRPVWIHPGMLIGQLIFHQTEPAERPYDGKYQNQAGPVESRYHRNAIPSIPV